MKRSFAVVVTGLVPVLLSTGLAVPVTAQQHFPATADLELMLRYMVEDGEAPGVALAVVDSDGTTRVAVYGAGPDGEPVTPETPFPIGEVTMTFTATLLADMAARGEVSLDDRVAEYMPDGVTVPSLSGYEITLRHLATHRSGLPAEPPVPYADFTLEDLYRFLGSYELDWVPGRSREISTVGYGLLGHALSRAAGTPLADLIRDRVLEPLGMAGAGFDPAIGPALRGGTGLLASATDMAAFVAANAGAADAALEGILGTTHEVRSGYDPEGEGYGFSWRTIARRGEPNRVTHGGRTPRSSVLVTFVPTTGIGTVVLASSPEFNDWAARDLLYFAAPSRPTVDVEPAVLRRYVGAYGSQGGRYRASPNSGSLYIRLDGDHLTYQPRGRIRTPLFALSDTSFYMLRAPLTVTFDEVGGVMEMAVVGDSRDPGWAGRTWRTWRVDTRTPRPDVAAENAPPWTAWGTGRWLILGLAGVVALGLLTRPLWSRRVAGR
ncbi:MAG: serine hydrolase domain-containing protein [Longimicrobiales bacterium]|nr:serine hydrolase domain-containing protein [Longimicrobiales bacterium]